MPGRPVPFNPPGLEYLTQIDQLLVHQKVEILETLIGYETKNKYHIKNIMGQKIFNAIEGKMLISQITFQLIVLLSHFTH